MPFHWRRWCSGNLEKLAGKISLSRTRARPEATSPLTIPHYPCTLWDGFGFVIRTEQRGHPADPRNGCSRWLTTSAAENLRRLVIRPLCTRPGYESGSFRVSLAVFVHGPIIAVIAWRANGGETVEIPANH